MAPAVREFHSNLRFRVGSMVYVRVKWVDFSAITINQVYNLVDNDSEAYSALKLVPNIWHKFIYATLKPSLHLSTVTRDKAILLYAIVQGIQFDVSHVIEQGIIESTQGRCTEALIHPPLITKLCRTTEVPMHDSKEKAIHRHLIPLPKSKEGVIDDMSEDEEEAVLTIAGDSTEDDDSTDKDIGDMLVAVQRELSRLSVRQDELARRQQL